MLHGERYRVEGRIEGEPGCPSERERAREICSNTNVVCGLSSRFPNRRANDAEWEALSQAYALVIVVTPRLRLGWLALRVRFH
jgi:hypothetical protein